MAPQDNDAAQRPGGMMHNDGDQMRKGNYGFRKVEVLSGNIGYVKFDAFLEGEAAQKTASAAMGFVSNCDAVIFDLRSNGGGSPEMIQYITSYLFDEPTHLNDMIDRNGSVVNEYWTLKDVPGKRLGNGRAGVCADELADVLGGGGVFVQPQEPEAGDADWGDDGGRGASGADGAGE